MDYTKELRTVGFCAGYAGIERGLELAGVPVRTVAFSEIEAYPVANLVSKMESGEIPPAPIWTDLKTFPMEKFRGKVDLLTGGFPCQPFSAAGARGGDEDPRHLFPYFKKFLGVAKPSYVFLENVDGIASAELKGEGWADPEGTPVLLHVCRELERLGYCVATGCFSAEEMGAPHKRFRWFIYGELGNPTECNIQIRESTIGGQSKRSERATGVPGWPAPPGNLQYEWEEPRAIRKKCPNGTRSGEVGNSSSTGSLRGVPSGEALIKQWCRPDGITYGSSHIFKGVHNGGIQNIRIEPQLGRTTHGSPSGVDATTNRMERLKMCGNGVVPQTAARAWIILQSCVRKGYAGCTPEYRKKKKRAFF